MLCIAYEVPDEGVVAHGLHILLTLNAETIKRTGKRHALQCLLVHGAVGDTLHEVVDVLVGAILLPFLNDGFGGGFAHALDRNQPEAYFALRVHTEVGVRLVHVGAIHLQSQ